jgi:hypothetical protein
MPPQQSDRLLDRLDQLFGFSPHDSHQKMAVGSATGKGYAL